MVASRRDLGRTAKHLFDRHTGMNLLLDEMQISGLFELGGERRHGLVSRAASGLQARGPSMLAVDTSRQLRGHE